MKLHNLKPAEGSVKQRKRVGRGEGSGRGGTSTRGHKGAQSRSGYSVKAGFEGGQMPLQRRIPKYGFNNIFRVSYKVFNLSKLQEIADKHNVSEISVDFLKKKRYIQKGDLVKVLGNGTISKAVTVNAHKFSESAKKSIENAGGSAAEIA